MVKKTSREKKCIKTEKKKKKKEKKCNASADDEDATSSRVFLFNMASLFLTYNSRQSAIEHL